MSLLPELDGAKYAPLLGGADYSEAFFEQSQGLSLRFEEGKIEDIGVSSEKGVGLRFLKRQDNEVVTYQGSSQDFSPEATSRLREGLGFGKSGNGVTLSPLKKHTHIVRVDPSQIPLEQKISLMRLVDKTIRSEFKEVRQVTLSYGERRRDLSIMNSDGAQTREERTAVIFSITVVAEKDGMLQTGHEVIGGLKGWEMLTDYDPLLFARIAARRAVEKLSAPKAKAGEMPIVLSSSAGGTFIHEAIGHSLEVDHVQEGSSPAYKDKVGKVIAPETITVVDDPTMPFHRGSFKFDDEGIEARPTPLVKNGVLTDYLYDRVTALREGKPSNGHGRRESFHCRPIPRMSNLYIAPGPDDPKKILKGLKAGMLVTRMGGGQVNTATGEFVFEVDEGFWVEDGKIRHMVRDANLLGIGPDVLKSIDRVGWDIGWGIGTCGKDGQGVPVGDGQPTLSIPKILIGGKSE